LGGVENLAECKRKCVPRRTLCNRLFYTTVLYELSFQQAYPCDNFDLVFGINFAYFN
jgi:hypothetical protein